MDEVQHVEEFERALASFKATLNCSIFITGSDSKILEGTLSTLLTGRTVQFKVYPFSYREALDFSRMEGKRVPEDFFKENYLKYGGYPQRFDYEDEEGILGYLNDLYRFVVEKDVFLQHKRLDKAKFAILSSYMLKHCGKPFSPDSIWRYYKGNEKVSLTSAAKNTIYSYLDIMKRCFFLQEEKEDRIEGREALRGLKKFYAYDNGMRIIQSKSNGWEKGFFLENIIYNECASRGYQIFYKEVKGRDLDLVLYKDGKKCYIQVCYSLLSSPKALKREYEALEKIKDNYPKFILSLDRERDSPFPLSLRGIRQIHVEDYLLGKEDIQLG